MHGVCGARNAAQSLASTASAPDARTRPSASTHRPRTTPSSTTIAYRSDRTPSPTAARSACSPHPRVNSAVGSAGQAHAHRASRRGRQPGAVSVAGRPWRTEKDEVGGHLVCLPPRLHDKSVGDSDAHDRIHALGPQRRQLLHVARQVPLCASRRERPCAGGRTRSHTHVKRP
jgi:hypothetical protein